MPDSFTLDVYIILIKSFCFISFCLDYFRKAWTERGLLGDLRTRVESSLGLLLSLSVCLPTYLFISEFP